MTPKTEFLRLRIATYNIHKCRGLDARTHPERIASILKKLKPDVVALQEVMGAGPRGRGQDEEIGERLGMDCLLAPARLHRGHLYGNALLSRLPMKNHTTFDLTQEGYEPRLGQRVDILLHGHRVPIYNVHLGTSRKERVRQAIRLLGFLSEPLRGGPMILLGDFNEGRKGPATSVLSEKLRGLELFPFLKWGRTYPGIFPLFHIDQIYYTGEVEITKVEVPRTWSALLSSDHTPILAELRIRARK